jgi:purine nucleoside phosphorylase
MTLRLDQAVDDAAAHLREALPAAPAALLLLGGGVGTLPGTMQPSRRIHLADVPGVPRPWREAELLAGRLGPLEVWMLEDAPGDLEFGEGGAPIDAPWMRAFPVWLAAAAGAQVCVLTAGGGGLDPTLEPPTLTVVCDYLNLSGHTPLEGMGETRLGPLFPDQSAVLHPGLRERALALASERGIPLREATVAGVMGPALATPAERCWYRAAGADVFVQGLSSPLHACAHAGLTTLALVAVTDREDEPLRMSQLVARAEQVAPALEDLILALLDDVADLAAGLEEELD